MIEIAGRKIGPGQPIFLQVEAGVTHGGDVERAVGLMDAAKAAGMDAVKFVITDPARIRPERRGQPFTYERVRLWDHGPFRGAWEQPETVSRPLEDLLRETQFTPDEWRRVQAMGRERGLVVYATVDDLEGLRLLCELDMPAIKISGWDIADLPLIRAVARTGKPTFIDVGAATSVEFWDALDASTEEGCPCLPVLAPHPTASGDWQLARLREWAQDADACVFGFSSPGRAAWPDCAAVALGACLLEKRLTLDRGEQRGHHHAISLEPAELKAWVRDVRALESALQEDPWGGSEEAWAGRKRWGGMRD